MRHRGVASTLCSSVWKPSVTAWGLVTSHPYAVHALERATGRRCDPLEIKNYASNLVKQSGIPYVQNCQLLCNNHQSVIQSQFFVDHSEIQQLLAKELNWKLGNIQDGEEFFAFTFQHQVSILDFKKDSYNIISYTIILILYYFLKHTR